jgi:hypothetical protein
MTNDTGQGAQMSQDGQVFQDDLDLAKVPADEFKTEILVQEIHQLEQTIRNLHQSATQTLGLAFVVAVFAASVTSGFSRDIAVTILPVLFALTVVYHLNASGEAAALAELRDRLSVRANRALGTRIFATRVVSDLRRASRGTAGSFILAGGIFMTSIIAGLVNAFSRHSTWWAILQIIITVVALATCLIAALDIPKARIDVNRGLDDFYGKDSRPKTAPSETGLFALLRASIWGRPGV